MSVMDGILLFIGVANTISIIMYARRSISKKNKKSDQEITIENISTSEHTGLTPDEQEIAMSIVTIWNKFNSLEQTHPDDNIEVADAIHKMQYILGMRTLRRDYPEFYPTYRNKDNDTIKK